MKYNSTIKRNAVEKYDSDSWKYYTKSNKLAVKNHILHDSRIIFFQNVFLLFFFMIYFGSTAPFIAAHGQVVAVCGLVEAWGSSSLTRDQTPGPLHWEAWSLIHWLPGSHMIHCKWDVQIWETHRNRKLDSDRLKVARAGLGGMGNIMDEYRGFRW